MSTLKRFVSVLLVALAVNLIGGSLPNAIAQNATPQAGSPGVWPLGQGGDAARTRNMPGPGPAGEPTVRWTFPTGEPEPADMLWGFPAVADGRIFLNLQDGGVIAIETATGAEIWRSTEIDGAMAVEGDGVIARSAAPSSGEDGFDLVRVSAKDGSEVWRAESGLIGLGPTPVIADGVLYMPVAQELTALDPATGERLWSAPMDAPASRGAAVGDGMIVLGDQTGLIYGFSITGARVWTYDAEATTVGHPAIANGMAYAVANDIEPGALYAFHLETGELAWTHTTTSAEYIILSPSVDKQQVYAVAVDGTVTALDAMSGEVAWVVSQTLTDVYSVTIVGEEVYVVGLDAFLHVLDSTSGDVRWSFDLGDVACSFPVVTGGVVYVASCKGTLYAIGGSDS